MILLNVNEHHVILSIVNFIKLTIVKSKIGCTDLPDLIIFIILSLFKLLQKWF